jgi:hypothetical protein
MIVRFAAHMNMRLLTLWLVLPVLLHATEPQKFSSGENRVHLFELYSSEGCSSCPPAEEWLGQLRNTSGLWRDFVPVAFHVAYWDRLGWTDRFASKVNTDRQYDYSKLWSRENTVYTPQFVLDGEEWRKSSGQNPFLPSTTLAGKLSVSYTPEGICRIDFAREGRYTGFVALLGGGIESKIGAGENDGRTLHHEFVVLTLKTAALVNGTVELKLPRSSVAGITRWSLAVWVARRGELTPLQATGGWLD